MHGYITDGMCPLCGEQSDTLVHRIMRCPCVEDERAMHLLADDRAWMEHVADQPAMSVLGMFPHPADRAPRPATEPCAHVHCW